MSFDEKLKKQPIPEQTIAAGQRVALRYDSGDYDGWNYLRAGLEGTVLGYATPDIQRRQIWPTESYYVRCPASSSASSPSQREIGPLMTPHRARAVSH